MLAGCVSGCEGLVVESIGGGGGRGRRTRRHFEDQNRASSFE